VNDQIETNDKNSDIMVVSIIALLKNFTTKNVATVNDFGDILDTIAR